MFRGLFIGIRRGLEVLGTLGKSELVQVGEGHLLPFKNFLILGEKGLMPLTICLHELEPKECVLEPRNDELELCCT
jgi:hypothetical protein